MSTLPDTKLRQVKPRFLTVRAIVALILREMSTTYGRSPGGYIWAIMEPAAGVTLLVLIFSIGFRSPPLGTSFALFYASGVLPFLMVLDITNKVAQSIQFSRSLLAYPRVTYIDAIMARFLLAAFTQFMVQFAVFGFILIFIVTNTALDISKIFQAYALVLCLAAGLGCMNCVLILAYPLWQSVWSIMTRPLILISGVLFIYDNVPEPYATYLWYNPFVHVVGTMRDAAYPFYNADYVSYTYVMLVAGICGLSGLFLLRRYYQELLLK